MSIQVVDGWLYLDGVRLCRVEGTLLAFKDKDRRRSSHRGTDQVHLDPMELIELLREELDNVE